LVFLYFFLKRDGMPFDYLVSVWWFNLSKASNINFVTLDMRWKFAFDQAPQNLRDNFPLCPCWKQNIRKSWKLRTVLVAQEVIYDLPSFTTSPCTCAANLFRFSAKLEHTIVCTPITSGGISFRNQKLFSSVCFFWV
jgi:hypothetical protein